MIPPVERAIQRMMNSHSKPGMPPHLDIHFQYFRHPLLPRGDAGHKNTNTDYCDAVLSHSVIICQGVTRDGNPYPF